MSDTVVKVLRGVDVPSIQKFNNLIALKLKEIDPDAFDECIKMSTPRIKDLELIPIVIDEIIAVYPYTVENQAKVLASIYLLFAPFKILQHDNKLPVGIRSKISKALQINCPETISQQSQNINVYWKNQNGRFKAMVTELADKIYNELNEAGFLDIE